VELVPGNRVTLLQSGTQYFPALEAAIDGALREIYLETYIFEEDATGRRIGEALMRAAGRGVAVQVLIDAYGSRFLGDGLIGELERAGVGILKYRPDISPWMFTRQKFRRLRRLHRKLAIVDDAVAFVGGINIIDDMHTPGQKPPRFDYAVQIEGPLLADVHRTARRMWMLVSAAHFKRRPDSLVRELAPPPWRGEQRAALVIRDNLRHRSDIEQAYLDAIGAAHSEILIASAYFFPGINFRRALTDAVARGVRVVLLLQGKVEYLLLHYASRALYGSLLEAGVQIYEYRKSFLHAKVAVIDQHWATVGSSNIDPFSMLLAREANVVLEDAPFAAQLYRSLQAVMAEGAVEVQRESWAEQSLALRAAIWAGYGLARFLTGVFGYGKGLEPRW
jgi:cardiolipin synthase